MRAAGRCERLAITRMEMERSRLRRKTDAGTDIGIVLNSTTRLQHGDVLITGAEKLVVVDQLPEQVMTVRVRKHKVSKVRPEGSRMSETMLFTLIGHAVGNRHRPISINKNDGISFPLHSFAEARIFRDVLFSISDKIEIKMGKQIFQAYSNPRMEEKTVGHRSGDYIYAHTH